MITETNLKQVLADIGFTNTGEIYRMHFASSDCDVEVNFNIKSIIYPDKLKYTRATTLNFGENENFVVLECVCRLLKQGYKPEHIHLEAPVPGGHNDDNAGYSDILIKDNNEKPYMIIECKTTEQTDNDQFAKAWSKTKKSGGQLFNYFNTYRQAKYLVLYTSDYVNSIVPIYNVISLVDNDEFLMSNKNLRSFRSVREANGSYTDYFDVWKNTYQQDYSTNGVLEDGIQPFNVGKKKLCSNDLVEIDFGSMQKKYHQYATILRQYNVSSKENAFDKLINLFLAKIIDETYNSTELKCYWKGPAYDNYYELHDRLHELYKTGMEEFFDDKITYVENQKIDDAFKFLVSKADVAKETIFGYIRELKYFNNNPFAILDVHNEELFNQNATILKEVVRMLQDIKLKSNKQNQFLGDLFEGFLDQGIKQSEGQFFTPMPIVRFLIASLPLEEIIKNNKDIPKAIDYACGSGHFLTEYANQIKPYVDNHKQIDIHEYYKNIIGIEKEYRLSKVSQVSTYMYGQNGIKIYYTDALRHNIEGVKNGSFNVLIANPPYSVKGFSETLNDESLSTYELTELISDRSKNGSIEVFFVERAKQLLADDGVAAIILPSTILSNSGIYVSCREIILKYFDIIAIAYFGSETFGKTNTNTATLFLRRRKRQPDLAAHYLNRVNSWFNGNFEDDDVYKDNELLERYCDHIGVLIDDYRTLLCGNPSKALLSTDIFVEYLNAFDPYKSGKAIKGLNENAKRIKSKIKDRIKKLTFKKLSVEEKNAEILLARNNFIIEIEKEKLYYFLLVSNNIQNVIIMKSPAKSSEQKKFLGYEWSHAKGNEGIKYLNSKNIDDEDDNTIERLKGVDAIETPLFNPRNLNDENKINSVIRANFTGDAEIPEELADSVGSIPLTNLIDFSKVAFSKEIKPMAVRKTVISTQYNTDKLKNLVADLGGLWTGEKSPLKQVPVIRNTNFTMQGTLNMNNVAIIEVEKNQFENRMLKKGDIIIEKSGGSETQAVGRVVLFDLEDDTYSYSNFTARLRIKEDKKHLILPEYLHAVLNYLYNNGETFYYQSGSSGLKNLNLQDYLSIKIPVPPIKIQNELIQLCKKIIDDFNSTRMSIEEYRNRIRKAFTDLNVINK